MSSRWLVILIFKALVLSPGRRRSGLSFATRLPLAPDQLFTFTPASAGSLTYVGLPQTSQPQIPGEYELAW